MAIFEPKATKKDLKKLKKQLKYLKKVSEANNEFLAQIFEVMQTVAASPAEEQDEPRAQIGFNTKTKKDDV